ncbi:MAG TPA: hypothetical protein VMO24_09030, partial [Woeseiaceae bacterium]|nr:hypothetical protein [Woeseiaceae bacterium]
MSPKAARLRDSGKFGRRVPARPAVLRPTTLQQLRAALAADTAYLAPFRPAGAMSASTDCAIASAGTVVDMTGFDQI